MLLHPRDCHDHQLKYKRKTNVPEACKLGQVCYLFVVHTLPCCENFKLNSVDFEAPLDPDLYNTKQHSLPEFNTSLHTAVLNNLLQMFCHEVAQCSLVRKAQSVRKHHRSIHHFTVN